MLENLTRSGHVQSISCIPAWYHYKYTQREFKKSVYLRLRAKLFNDANAVAANL